MSENLNLQTVDTVDTRPFRKLIMTIGELPTSFVESMTYYELLAWFTNYLETVIIPTVNNNADCVEELQDKYVELKEDNAEFVAEMTELYNQLKSYVDNYFDTLDVQDEIDQKLDEMASDGTLESLISTQILGDLTQLHTTDKSSIVAAVNEVNDNEAALASSITRLINDKVLLIGDSYLQGYNGTQNVNSWGYYFKQASGLSDNNLKILYESGAGFTKQGNAGHTFLELLQANISTFTDKNSYTDIIIGFGLNENDNTAPTITTAIGNFVTYAKAQFPNASIYLGMVGNLKVCLTSQNNTGRERLYIRPFMAAKNASQFGVKYLTGVEQVAHNYELFGVDNIHLTQDGYQALGWGIYQAWKTGAYNYNVHFGANQTITFGGDLAGTDATMTAQVRITGVNRQVVLANSTINFTPFTVANARIKITADGEMANNSIFRSFGVAIPVFYMQAKFTKSDNSTVIYPCNIQMDTNNGSLVMNVPSDLNGSEIKQIKTMIYDIYNLPTLLS